MSRGAQARRDLMMLVEQSAGATQSEIAARHGVCVRTVRRAIKRARAMTPGSVDGASVRMLGEYMAWLDVAISELAVARMSAASPRTRLAATRVQLSLMTSRLGLLSSLGMIGATEEAIRLSACERIANHLMDAARRDGLGAEFARWLRAETAKGALELVGG